MRHPQRFVEFQSCKRLALIAMLSAPLPALAQSYYCSPTGVDTNAGTSGAPFREIRKALTKVVAGDTVFVADGGYLGFDVGGIQGTAANPITIKAQGANAVVNVTTDRNDNRDTIFITFDANTGTIPSQYVVIDGLTSFNANRAAMRIDECPHITVQNCTFGNNLVWGIFTDFSDNLLLQNNTCYGSQQQHGIYVSNTCTNPTVRGNTLYNNFANGLHMNGDVSQGGVGIITNALVENNIIYSNGLGGGGSGINCDGVQNSVFRNNLVYNAHGAGISLYQQDASQPANNNIVENNTFDIASDGKWGIQIHSGSQNNTVFNNIVLTHHSFHGSLHFDGASNLVGLKCDYNILTTSNDCVTTDDDNSYLTFAAWQGMGFDTHSQQATQASLFVNFGTGDYHLLSPSAAIDKGIATFNSDPAPTTDRDGNARPSGAGYDIGCYEFQSATPAIITASPLPQGTVGAVYSQIFSASGGTGPYTYSITAGSPPAGLTLTTPTLSGTPTTAGTASFTVQVKDSLNATSTKSFQLTINAAISITTSSLPQGTVNAAYSQTLALTGGTSPFTWSITSGSLPAGLSLNAGTGAITGTPTVASSGSITFKVTDAAGATATQALTLTINAALGITTTSPLAGGTVGTAYSKTFVQSGGTSPFTWSISAGSVPAGLALSAAGVLSGTPTASGTANFTVKVKDAALATVTKGFALTITPALAITTPSPLPAGTVNVAYSQPLSATGGTPPYTWTLASGTLPAGLSLTAGVISGTPTAAGTSNFSLKVADSAGASVTQVFALTINLITISTASPLPAGTAGTAYSQTFAAVGGTLPYTWSVISGTLPAGLSLSTGGVLSGTPTAAGASNFTVQVTDKNNATASQAFALTINPQLVLTTITVSPAFATVKSGNTQQYSAVGLDQFGTPLASQPAFAWSVSGGGTISATGLFTASAGGTFTVTAASAAVSGTASVRVNAPPTITSPPSSGSPIVVVNVPTTFSAGATDPNGGTVTYTWNFGDGTSATGANVSHTFTSVGNFTVTVTIADTSGDMTVATLPITVVSGAAPTIPMTVLKLAGAANFKTSGHDGCAISGTLPNLPAGLTTAGQTLTLSVGGATATFTLDKRGHGKSAQGIFALKLKLTRDKKTHKSTFIGGNGSFTATLKKGTWAAVWGLDPTASANKTPMQIAATIQFIGNTYAQTVTVTYSAKAHVGGKFKK